ncbi:gamma-glutamylcyclotransferase family protein [Chloroflexota bacterium]
MNYFAYGSNLSKNQMRERCPESNPAFPATLPNYKLVFSGWSRRWRGGTASIKHSRGDKVHGAIYEISDKDLRQLDRYEGYPTSYNRLNITVFDEDGTAHEAMTYIKSGQLEETDSSREYAIITHEGYKDWGLL